MATKELVGCKIKGVKHLLQTAGNLFVSIDAGTVKLALFFAIVEKIASDPEQKRYYRELAAIAKDDHEGTQPKRAESIGRRNAGLLT